MDTNIIPPQSPNPSPRPTWLRNVELLNRLLVIFIVGFALLMGSFFIVFKLKGEKLFREKLQAAIGRPIHLDNLRVALPFGIAFDNFEIEGMLKAGEVILQFGFPDFSGRQINVASLQLYRPVVILHRTKGKKIVIGDIPPEIPTSEETTPSPEIVPPPAPEVPIAPSTSSSFTRAFWVGYFSIEEGKLSFIDHSGENDFVLDTQDINLRAWKVSYPLADVNTRFTLAATIAKSNLPFSGSTLEAKGWFNWLKKNLDAKLLVKEPDGRVSLNADAVSKNNNMTVKGHLHVKNFLGSVIQPKEQADSFEDLVFEALAQAGIEIDTEFNFQTKMDDFQAGPISFAGAVSAGEEGESPKGVKGIGKQFEDFGKKLRENLQDSNEAPPAPATINGF